MFTMVDTNYYKFDFEWPSIAAKSVYVTGTFDNWSKSIQLFKDSDKKIFKTTVKFSSKDKIIFKYIVDDDWCINNKLKTERDSSGIENNVVFPEDFKISDIESNDDFDMVNNDYIGKSDTETESSAFTSVSYPSREDENENIDDFENFNDDEIRNEIDEDLSNSTQITINGDSSFNTAIINSNSRNSSLKNISNLSNLENTAGERTYNANNRNMISRFKNLFKS